MKKIIIIYQTKPYEWYLFMRNGIKIIKQIKKKLNIKIILAEQKTRKKSANFVAKTAKSRS